MAHQVKVLVAESDDLRSIPGENQLLDVVL